NVGQHWRDRPTMEHPVNRHLRGFRCWICRVSHSWYLTKGSEAVYQPSIGQDADRMPGVVQITHKEHRLISLSKLIDRYQCFPRGRNALMLFGCNLTWMVLIGIVGCADKERSLGSLTQSEAYPEEASVLLNDLDRLRSIGHQFKKISVPVNISLAGPA